MIDSVATVVTVTERVTVRHSQIHGRGLFARTWIPRDSVIIEYVGERIDKAECDRRLEAGNEYIFEIDEDTYLDGNVDWNPARLINHSCAANCRAEPINGRVWIVAERDIEPGEELSFNYGFDLQDFREHRCRCNAPACVGYIVAEELVEEARRLLGVVGDSALPGGARPPDAPAGC